MKKEKVTDYLRKTTENFSFHDDLDLSPFETNEIAALFSAQRTTISRILNEGVKEDELIKINTRPVYFLHKRTFEQKFGKIKGNVFKNFQDLSEYILEDSAEMFFRELIGYDKSLKEVLEQMKTAIFYPDNGLPIMLLGPTGIGKTYLARLMYEYTKAKKLIKQDAPFYVFNCAQYANNPELLTSYLFGHVKGAYTGADKDKAGLLEMADEGILFLDEAHRLNREGQEKLFTFMDQGTFYRLGDTEIARKAKVRLVFATTEKTNHFLETFLRRIPIKVSVPSLDERGPFEKSQLIEHFFMEESQLFQLPIEVSHQTLDALHKYHYEGNIGECKNMIKYTCGSAYAKAAKGSDKVKVTLQDLPKEMLKNAPQLFNHFTANEGNVIFFSGHKQSIGGMNELAIDKIRHTFKNCLKYYQKVKDGNIEEQVANQKMCEDITVLLDQLIFNRPDDNINIMMGFTLQAMQEFFRYLETNHHIKYEGNNVYALSSYLFFKTGLLSLNHQHEVLSEQLLDDVKQRYKKEYQIALMVKTFIENRIEFQLGNEDIIMMTLFLSTTKISHDESRIKAMIIAHGYATASSIANVCNRILGVNVFDSLDMEIEATTDDIIEKLRHYLEINETNNGLIIFVDMGSLNQIQNQIQEYIDGPLLFIDQVTTMPVLEVGHCLMKGNTIHEIAEHMQILERPKVNLLHPKKKKAYAIVTSCFTGIGTAMQIQKLLEKSIKDFLEVHIVAHDFDRLKKNGMNEAPFQLYDVLAIVGTANPGINGVNFISLEDIISGKGENDVFRIFGKIAAPDIIRRVNDNIILNFSLDKVIESLTILDTEKLIKNVEKSIIQLEKQMNRNFSNDKKIALYVHISCMVERLIRLSPITEYPDQDLFEQAHTHEIHAIKSALSVLEDDYCVQLNIPEIGYIFNIMNG